MIPSFQTIDRPDQPARQPSLTPGASPFVWGIWTLMLLAALAFVQRYGSDAPFGDEWRMVPALTGHQAVTVEYLWHQHNEHRIPLPTLTYLALAKLARCDFRAGIIFNVVALALLSLAMIRAAKELRGWTSYSDAFFPLALLHWGHFENILSGFQLMFVLSTALAVALLVIIARNRGPMRFEAAMVAGPCLLALPYCGAQGLALVPALALWFGMTAIDHWRPAGSGSKFVGLLRLFFASAALASVGLYFRGLQYVSQPPRPGMRSTASTALEFLTSGFGYSAASLWPISGFIVLGLLIVSVGLLVVVWSGRPEEKTRVLGLLSFLGAMGSLALGLAWGRSGFGSGQGFVSRYNALAVPVLCCIYFVWVLYGGPIFRHLTQMSLFALMCACLLPNSQFGSGVAKSWREVVQAFEEDLDDGMPLSRLVDRHYGRIPILPPFGKDQMGIYLMMLQQSRVGQFRHLRPDLPLGLQGPRGRGDEPWPSGYRPNCCRVGMWCDGLGLAYLFPVLSDAGASIALPCLISTPRSSNPAGGCRDRSAAHVALEASDKMDPKADGQGGSPSTASHSPSLPIALSFKDE